MSATIEETSDYTWYQGEQWILLDAPQTSPPWFDSRKGRVTGSINGACCGRSKFPDSSPEDQVQYLNGSKVKQFSEESKYNMRQGQLREPLARDWYCQKFNKICVEGRIVFPLWETRIGASVDGIVIDKSKVTKPLKEYNPPELIKLAEGILEIKAPKKMYWYLTNYVNTEMHQPNSTIIAGDAQVYKHYYSHIWQTHFDQMQQGMVVLRKPWCDYVVYAPEGIYYQRIPYCHRYFIKYILEPVREFLDKKLDPTLPAGYRLALPIK